MPAGHGAGPTPQLGVCVCVCARARSIIAMLGSERVLSEDLWAHFVLFFLSLSLSLSLSSCGKDRNTR